jgi:phosphopantothenoylcysteine decarboxylase/phosphopantothenate--cysteine ligase
MKSLLADKKILFGISGSIAVYKAAEWVRELAKTGADVTVVMSDAATRFVSSLTFATLSGNRVYTGMFEQDAGENVTHINLARECDLFIIAPATAQTIAKLANGFADNLLSSLALASRAKMLARLIWPVLKSMNTLLLNQRREYLPAVMKELAGSLNGEWPGKPYCQLSLHRTYRGKLS